MAERAFLVWDHDYENSSVVAAFARRELAERYVAERDDFSEDSIEELELRDKPLGRAPYWHFGAEVYPDKTVKRWGRKHWSDDTDWLEPVDTADRLHARGEPWDGHTQGHCGFHVSVFGTDRDLARKTREQWVKHYLPMCDGICPGCGRTGEPWYRGMDSTEPVDVVFVGGPRDGEISTEQKPMLSQLDSEWEFPWGGVLHHFSFKLGDEGPQTADYCYGQARREGERWVRPFIEREKTDV